MPITYRPLAYTGPQTGQRIEFVYDGNIEDGVTHNLGEFQFSGVDGKFYQDRSLSFDPYSFTIFLKSDEQLKVVRDVLNEKTTEGNPGTLEHPDPTLGNFPVVVSSYKKVSNSVKGQGIITLSITFFRTIPNLIGGDPSESSNPASANATLKAIDELNIQQAVDFENSVDLSTGSALATLTGKVTGYINLANEKLKEITSKSEEISALVTTTVNDILFSIDELVKQPFELARQVQNLLQLPMLATDIAADRIIAYKLFIDDMLTFVETEINDIKNGTASGKNILSSAGLFSLATVSAINYSAVSARSLTIDEIKIEDSFDVNAYISRTQIIESIQAVQGIAQGVTETLSQLAVTFGAKTFFTQYFDYSILNKSLIAGTVRNLNKRIFSTAREIVFATEEELTPIQWCAILYKSVSVTTVMFFIETNNIHGDEIYLVKKGREIVYYD